MPETQEPYDPDEYWTRLHSVANLRSVGQSGLPATFNGWLYRIGRANVRAFMRKHGLGSLSGATVLDIGSGTGFWIDEWLAAGADHVDGCDLVPAAVDRLQARYPGSSFTCGDIADPGVVLASGYDLVAV